MTTEIESAYRDEYSECPMCDASDRHIYLQEYPEIYDGGLFWRCDACGAAWHRWGATTRGVFMRAKTQPFLDEINAQFSPALPLWVDSRLSPDYVVDVPDGTPSSDDDSERTGGD